MTQEKQSGIVNRHAGDHGHVLGLVWGSLGSKPTANMARLRSECLARMVNQLAKIKRLTMKRDMSGPDPGKKSFGRKGLSLDRAGISAYGRERMRIRTGNERFPMLMGPSRRAQVRIQSPGQPFNVEHAPLDGIDAVNVIVKPVAQATGVRVKRMGRHHQHPRFACTQGTDFIPGRFNGQIAFVQIEHNKMPAVHFRLHAGDQENVTFAGISHRFGMRTNFAMPRDGNRVEAHLSGLVDVLENRVTDVSVNGITLAMAM